MHCDLNSVKIKDSKLSADFKLKPLYFSSMKLIVFVVLFWIVATTIGEKARFDNYRVYSIEVENDDQLQVLKELENQQNGLLFLMPPTINQTFVELVVPPHKFAEFFELCEKFHMQNNLKIDNLQRFDFG